MLALLSECRHDSIRSFPEPNGLLGIGTALRLLGANAIDMAHVLMVGISKKSSSWREIVGESLA